MLKKGGKNGTLKDIWHFCHKVWQKIRFFSLMLLKKGNVYGTISKTEERSCLLQRNLHGTISLGERRSWCKGRG